MQLRLTTSADSEPVAFLDGEPLDWLFEVRVDAGAGTRILFCPKDADGGIKMDGDTPAEALLELKPIAARIVLILDDRDRAITDQIPRKNHA